MNQEIYRVCIGEFLKAQGQGAVNIDECLGNLKNLVDEWKQNPKQNVLVDMRKRPPSLGPGDIHKLVDVVARTGLGYFNRVALLYLRRPHFDEVKFLESIAKTHGMDIRGFESYEEALQWLTESEMLLRASGDRPN
ncbi:hypothetical protein K2X33_02285 [bacterium]|nr:hypothetical protein [bacterium]